MPKMITTVVPVTEDKEAIANQIYEYLSERGLDTLDGHQEEAVNDAVEVILADLLITAFELGVSHGQSTSWKGAATTFVTKEVGANQQEKDNQ